jgi:hypothetical protein
VNPLTCFLMRKQKLSLKPPLQPAAQRANLSCERLLPFAIHTQTWSRPMMMMSFICSRVEGLCSNWNESRDSVSSLGRPNSLEGASPTTGEGRHDGHNGD